MKKYTFLVGLLIFGQVFGATTKSHMNKAFSALVELTPYLLDDKAFIDENNEEKISAYINDMEGAFRSVHKKKKFLSENYRPSAEIIYGHLKETKANFSLGHKYFARNRLNALTTLCISCHSQLGTKASGRVNIALRKYLQTVENDFQKAEINYLLRNYKESIALYTNYIKEEIEKANEITKKSGLKFISVKNINTAINRVINYYTKTHFTPHKSLKFLASLKAQKSLPVDIQQRVVSLEKQVLHWEKDSTMKSETKISSIAKKYLTPLENKSLEASSESDILMLLAQGRILKIMELEQDREEIALGLYWLAKTERKFNFSYYYSLADIHLEDCIKMYTTTKVAPACLEEYRDQMEVSFSGSSGLSLPKDIREKLTKYGELIKKTKQK